MKYPFAIEVKCAASGDGKARVFRKAGIYGLYITLGCGDARPRVEPALGVSAGMTLAEARAEAGALCGL